MPRTVNSIKSNHNENWTRLTLLTPISAAYGAKKTKQNNNNNNNKKTKQKKKVHKHHPELAPRP